MGGSSRSRTSSDVYNQQQDRSVVFAPSGNGNQTAVTGNVGGDVVIENTDHGAIEASFSFGERIGALAIDRSADSAEFAIEAVQDAHREASESASEQNKAFSGAISAFKSETQGLGKNLLIVSGAGAFSLVAIVFLIKK